VIGIKCWVYKGEILPGAQKRGLRGDPEPSRRMPPRDRERRDRDRDRGPRPSGDFGGGATQQAPSGEMKPAPILPPMAAPVQPTWKQENPPEGTESKPEGGKPESGTPESGKSE